MAKLARRLLRVTAWLMAFFLLVVLLLVLLIRTPWGNEQIRHFAESWLRKKLETELSIGTVRLQGLHGIEIRQVMLRDKQRDTLLSLESLSVNFNLAGLTQRRISIPSIRIAGLHSEIRRPAGHASFNYQFLADAFASESTDTAVSTAGSWDIRLGLLEVSKTALSWNDGLSGDNFRLYFEEMILPLTKTDFSQMQFQAGKSHINGLHAQIRMGSAGGSEADTASMTEVPNPLSIRADKLTLTNTRFSLSNPSAGLQVDSDAKTLSLDRIGYTLANGRATGGTLVLHDHVTTVAYRSASDKADAQPAAPGSTSASPFAFYLDSLSIERNGLALDDVAAAPLKRRQFDAAHIRLQDLLLKASSIRYDSTGYFAKIRALRFRDANGFTVKKLQADARFSDTALTLDQVVLETPQNKLSLSLDMSYASLDKLVSSPATTKVKLDVSPSVIRLDELGYFSPDLVSNAQLKSLSKMDIRFSLNARGTLDQLELPDYRAQAGGSLIRGRARLLHPTDPPKLQAQVILADLITGKNDLKSLLAPGTIPDSAWRYIPDKLAVRGTLNASMQSIRPDLVAQSSFGTLTLKGYLEQYTDPEKARYDLQATTPGLALGTILEDTSLGNITGTVLVKGMGFNPETMQAAADASVFEAGFKGYAYSGIDIHGIIDRGNVRANVSSREPNLDLDADLGVHLGKTISGIRLKSDIRQADLHALGFMDSAFSVRGRMDIDFPVADTNRIEGTAMFNDLSLQIGSRKFRLDTIRINAHNLLDSQYITVRSPLADVDVSGRFSLNAIPEAARTILDNWLVMDGALKTFPQPLYAEVQANVHIPDSLAPLIPGLKSAAPFVVRGGIDTRENALLLISVLPRIEYADYTVDSVTLLLMQVDSIDRYKKSRFVVQAERIQGNSFMLNRSIIGGQVSKGIVDATLAFLNTNDELRYRLPVKYVNDPAVPFIHIPDSIMLNGTRWEVNQDNRVYISPDKLRGSNLQISQGVESISLKADPNNPSGLPLSLDIGNLQLESLTGMFIGQTKLLMGRANGKARLSSMNPTAFEAELGIDSLRLFGSSFGDLHIKGAASPENRYLFDVTIRGAGNDFAAGGSYDAPTGAMDIQVHMAPLSLDPLAPFLSLYADSARGGLRGDLRIGGTTQKPTFNGRLALDSSYMVVRQTGTPLYIPEASLLFNGQQIRFEGMRLLDSAGRPATITGSGRAENLADISYDLNVQSDKFLVSGRKRYEEQLVSGPLYAGLLLNIRGDLGHAEINGKVNVIDSSQVTYVYRPDEDGANGEGLIEFFDPTGRDTTDSLAPVITTTRKPGFQLAVNSYINVTSSSTVNIVLDENTGDQLTAKGRANLNFTMDPGGTMEMTGNYEVESGTYNMTIGGLLKKSFALEKGSTITWSGDILKANTDLTAKYTVRTDAEELLREVESVPGANRQKFDFEVYMMIKGEMLKPGISFRLDMPTKEQSAFNGVVYTRLRQVNSIPSELNKQVMGLLALNSFIADNPFNSLTSSGGSFETQAFSTAGRLLTQELNSFLGDVIKDVDIDIGLDIRDDYISGEAQRRSDLKVGFTKSLAHNRLSIYVGNTFALEHHNQNTNAMAGLAGDVSMEYMLTRDGKYRIKGFRLTEEDLTFNGIVVKTGVTFVVVLEFNRFKNAFRSKRKKNTVQP